MQAWILSSGSTDFSNRPVFRLISRGGVVGTEPLYEGSISDIVETSAAKAE